MAVPERAGLRGSVLSDRYHVGPVIGVGGTGLVFEATRLDSDAPLALKTLRPAYAANVDIVTRLKREAEVATRVGHPGIVPVVDEGLLPDGSPYIVMERASGESLNRVMLRSGPLPCREAALVGIRVASILHSVHTAGYVHRDIKPEHVLLDRTDDGELEVRLLDFGVCASDHAPREEREKERGRVYGTPSYSSPEQASGDPYVDPRADVYGLGVLLFECVTGRVPFSAADVHQLLRRIVREEAPSVRAMTQRPIDERLALVIERAIARAPDDRFPSMRAFARALLPVTRERVADERVFAAKLRIAKASSERATAVGDVVAA